LEAVLGFKIDSSQASGAAANLDDLAASANRTTAAVDKLEAEAATLGTALGKTGRGAREAQAPVESLGRSLGQQDDHVRAFRMEVERLTAKYQPLAAATKSYEASVSEIERAHRMGILSATQMQRALDAERMAYERLKNSATTAGAAMKAANANAPTGNANRMNTANIGFQFQDIAVTSAMGMSPLMIGLQQGTQLASVLGTMTNPVNGLVAAFTSLINPVSLITIGLTAGTAALIQYFMAGDDESEKMNADLERQIDMITTVADRWGDAAPALKAYADELDRTRTAQIDQQAANDAAALKIKELKTNYDDLISVMGRMDSDYSLSNAVNSADTNKLLAFREGMIGVNAAISEGKDPTTDLNAAMTALSSIMQDDANPVIRDFFELMSNVADKMRDVAGEAKNIRDAFQQFSPLSAPWSDNGQILFEENFIPFGNAPVPRPRPNIELNGDGSTPGAPMVLNSDGRLVPVPTPGARPNYFEQEAMQPAFNSTRTGANSWDRSILMEEMRRNEMGSMFKGFITDFGSALRESGGDLGKALMQSLSNAMMNAASQAWDKFASLASTALVNLIMGQPSAGLLNKGVGFTGANTTLGNLLGTGTGLTAANQNVAGMASGNGVQGQVWNFFAGKGLAPHQIAGIMGNVSAESAFNPSAVGDNSKAFGLFQHRGNRGGSPSMLGNTQAQLDLAWQELQGSESGAMKRLMSATDVRGATSAFAGFERPQGWSLGNPEASHNFIGRLNGAEEALAKFGGTTTSATQGLGQLGTGLGQMGSALSSMQLSPLSGSAVGQNGGLWGGIGKLLGGISPTSPLWAPNTTFGSFIGAYANGTDSAPGGLSVVGERGPELVNLPEGARVFSNHKSMDMMRGTSDRQDYSKRPMLNIHVYGANTDAGIRELVRQGAQEAIYNDRIGNERGGFGAMQQNYAKRKG